MPRQRPRRRRRAAVAPDRSAVSRRPQIDQNEPMDAKLERRSGLLSAGVVTALGLGIWLGWTITSAGGIAETIVLWVGVILAGLGGGRLLRRALQRRRQR